jgi:hypothetical protein
MFRISKIKYSTVELLYSTWEVNSKGKVKK